MIFLGTGIPVLFYLGYKGEIAEIFLMKNKEV
jgi:hypothetical protein